MKNKGKSLRGKVGSGKMRVLKKSFFYCEKVFGWTILESVKIKNREKEQKDGSIVKQQGRQVARRDVSNNEFFFRRGKVIHST